MWLNASTCWTNAAPTAHKQHKIIHNKTPHLAGSPSIPCNIHSLHQQHTVAAVSSTKSIAVIIQGRSAQTHNSHHRGQRFQTLGNTVACTWPFKLHNILTWKYTAIPSLALGLNSGSSEAIELTPGHLKAFPICDWMRIIDRSKGWRSWTRYAKIMKRDHTKREYLSWLVQWTVQAARG